MGQVEHGMITLVYLNGLVGPFYSFDGHGLDDMHELGIAVMEN